MFHAYFPYDKSSREKVRKFVFIKGSSYMILAVVTIIELLIGSSNLVVPCLTIFITIMEAIQNIIQSKAEQFIETAEELMDDCKKNRSFYKEAEMLYIYCNEQIERLRVNTSPDLEQLVFEKIYDCLKYYSTANKFILTFNNYRELKCTYEDLQKALDEWKEDFQSYGVEIVKNPNYK